ncbi:MAG: two pore domain potassium channel family protein [Alphaproteobacteria bacterium]|nr:two pore domain potassium channel family protein [Alphaproteobacteria bacterium]
MFLQLLLGAGVVSITIAMAAAFIGAAIFVLRRSAPWIGDPPPIRNTIIALTLVSLWLLVAISVTVWVWAVVFMFLDLFASIEPALYFAAATLTTLGYGDIILPISWRLLTGICAANGLLLFGLCAAFLFEVFARLHGRKDDVSNEK